MIRLLKPFLKLPYELDQVRINLNKNNYDGINLYFQDESRFGLMTHIGKCLTSRGVKPIVKYKHCFDNTYLYGSFSPINGDAFIYEIAGVSSNIFFNYLEEFSKYKPREMKIVIIDNAGFHSLKDYTIPENIKLIRIPPYSPELNPSEKIWAFIKQRFKNKVYQSIEELKNWLHGFVVQELLPDLVKSITHDKKYIDCFKAQFEV